MIKNTISCFVSSGWKDCQATTRFSCFYCG